jgi:hypothetical protein
MQEKVQQQESHSQATARTSASLSQQGNPQNDMAKAKGLELGLPVQLIL